jgi:hypothetical protein
MGYVEETGAAQYLRDARIAPIYEGTNGIQAMDLVMRKLPLEGGEVVRRFMTEMTEVLDEMSQYDSLAGSRDQLTGAIQGLAETSTWLGEKLESGDYDAALAGASPFLRQFGTVIGGWLMAISAVEAEKGPADFDPEFLADKVNTARFFNEQLLPQANGLVPTVKGGKDLLSSARF